MVTNLRPITIPDKLFSDESLRSSCLSLEEYPIPKPYCIDRIKVKAIILGADPSNFTNSGSPKLLDTVFGIGSDEKGYFDAPYTNMRAVGLDMEHVYIDNLVKNYCTAVTEKNKQWSKMAKEWLPVLKAELDALNPSKKIPVLLTAGKLTKFLVTGDGRKVSNINYYKLEAPIPIPSTQSKLERPLIPFYRNTYPPNYLLTNPRWQDYAKSI